MHFLELEKQDSVAVLTINREPVLNALNDTVIDELSAALDAMTPENTRCIVITGKGTKAFIAGADIGQMAERTREQVRIETKKGISMLAKLQRHPVPTIAAINGYALGGGLELALCCDIRIASENARLGLPEVTLGIIPGYGGTQRLPRLIPVGLAKELIFTGRRIGAAEVVRIGLVNAVYPQERLLDEAMKLARSIAANAPIAVRAAKRAIDAGIGQSLEDGLAMELQLCADCFETEDQRNAMVAFLEKRKPDAFANR